MKTNKSIIAGVLALAIMPGFNALMADQSVMTGDGLHELERAATSTENQEVVISGEALFTNRYVTEGTNIAPGSTFLFQGEVAAELIGFTAGAAYVQSISGTSYNEINLFGGYGFSLGPVDLFAGVTFLTYPSTEDANSWEISLGFEWEILAGVTLFGETYYDIDDINGGFLELGVAYELPLDLDPLTLEPYIMIGIDYGYVSSPRALKENNLQIGLQATCEVADNWDLFAAVHHSFALTNLRNEDEGDITWFQAGVQFEF